MASPPSKPTPRRIADRYELLGKIGDGATGVVWRARDTVLARDVAIKTSSVVGALGSASHPAADRMLVEAKALARLEHPSVVRVLDFGRLGEGQPYVVMELLEGEDLERFLERKGRLPDVEAVRLLLPVLDGLAMAHECGVLHRDVKPANIFLTRTGRGGLQPKLVDFGLAKLEDESAKLTIDGTVCGSPHYLAPERVRAQPATPLSDIWGIAATLSEVLSGLPPFDGTTIDEVMSAVLTAEPRALPPGTDAHLEVILERGLAREPTARWPSVRIFGQQLAQWLLSRGITEDACGNSLASTWIADRPAPGFDVARTSLVPPPAQDESAAPATSARVTVRRAPPRTGRARKVGAAVLAALALVGAAFHLRTSSPARPVVSATASPSMPPTEVTPPAPSAVAAASHPSAEPTPATTGLPPRARSTMPPPHVTPRASASTPHGGRYENLGF